MEDQEVIEGKFFAAIAYLGFLCIITLVLRKDNKFALFHGKRGLVLFVFEVASFLFSIIPLVGFLLRTVGSLVFLLVSIWGIYQALSGFYARIPVISDIAEKITL